MYMYVIQQTYQSELPVWQYKPETPNFQVRHMNVVWIYLQDFLTFFTGETNSMTSILVSCTQSRFGTGVYSKRSEFFPFKIDTYWHGRQYNFLTGQSLLQVCPFPLNTEYKEIPSDFWTTLVLGTAAELPSTLFDILTADSVYNFYIFWKEKEKSW